MRDTPTSLFHEDFRTRYRNAYGWLVKDDESKVLVYIKDVNRQVVFTTVDLMEYYANYDQGVMFEFLPITRGWYQTRDGVVLLQRIPAKQYCRGISKGNTACSTVNSYGEFCAGAGLTHQIIHDVFVAKPVSVLASFLAGLSPTFIINPFFLIAKDYVYMYDRVIGTYNDKNITLDSSMYVQELSDSLQRINAPIGVKVNE